MPTPAHCGCPAHCEIAPGRQAMRLGVAVCSDRSNIRTLVFRGAHFERVWKRVVFDIPKCAARLRLLPLNLRGFVVSFCSFYHELTDFLLGTCGFPFARWRREYPKGAGAVAETAGSSPTRIMTAAPKRKTSPPPKLRPNPRV
jgi:hypothetical protein